MGSALGDELEYYASHPMLLLYLHLGFFVLFCLCGVANRRIPWTDHSRAYFCFNYGFFYVYTFGALMPVLNRVLPFRIHTLSFLGDELAKFIYPLVVIHFMMSTIGFLAINWRVAFKRRQIERPWAIFLGICPGSLVLFAVIKISEAVSFEVYKSFFDFTNRFLLGFLVGTVIVMIFGICVCPSSPPGSPTDPWISYAKRRLAWSLIYVPLPAIPILFTVLHSFKPMETVKTVEDVRIYAALERIPKNFHALFFAIAGIFLLPAYRTALFTREGWNRNEKKKGVIVTKLSKKVIPEDYSSQSSSNSKQNNGTVLQQTLYPATSQAPTGPTILGYPVSNSQTTVSQQNLGATLTTDPSVMVPVQSSVYNTLSTQSYQGSQPAPVLQPLTEQQVLYPVRQSTTSTLALPGQMSGYVTCNLYTQDGYFLQQNQQSQWNPRQEIIYQNADHLPILTTVGNNGQGGKVGNGSPIAGYSR